MVSFGEFLQSYWWACLIYFCVGFFAYWAYELKEGHSFNGFFGDLFVATMWGLLWGLMLPIFVLLSSLLFLEKRLKESFGWHVRLLASVPFCMWLGITAYLGVHFIRGGVELNTTGAAFWGLVWLVVGCLLFKRITASPNLPDWLVKDVKESERKFRMHKESKRDKDAAP